MKSLLIITDVFPPLAGAGIKRILKFAKFLPAHGWDCTVLTADNERILPQDPSLVAEVPPGVRVVRTVTFESWFRGVATGPAATVAPAAPQPRGWRALKSRLYKGLGQFVRVPDSRILWLPSAIWRGIRLWRRHRFDAILATGPSFTNFLAGAWIKVFTGTPLLLDVRDAWLADPTRRIERSYLRRLDAACERFAFRRADRVVTTNPFVTADFARRYPRLGEGRCDTIYNGYDPADFAFAAALPPAARGPFTIVHTGRLYAERTPEHFLRALGQAVRQRPEMRTGVRVQFVGSSEVFDDGRRIEDYVAEFQLEGMVEVLGRVSRQRSLQYQLEADLLLLVIGIVPPAMALTYGISGKLFDYAVCNKGILTVANEGATRELIRTHHLGDVFMHQDTDGLRDYLLAAFATHAAGGRLPGPTPAALAPFEFRALVGRLSGHLDALAAHRAPAPSAPNPSAP